jgi:hypothetical protein
MPYDFDDTADRSQSRMNVTRVDSVAAVRMALEIAALNLTSTGAADFSLEQLVDEACAMGDSETPIGREAAAQAAQTVPFLETCGDRLRLV